MRNKRIKKKYHLIAIYIKRVLKKLWKSIVYLLRLLKKFFKTVLLFIVKVFLYILHAILILLRVFWYIFQRIFLLSFILTLTIWLAWWLSQTPSLYIDWTTTEAILPEITFSGSNIEVKNVRNFTHTSTEEHIVNYYDEIYNLDEIESVYYIIEPFSDYDWPAHTMLSFGFSWDKYVTISAELRKEKWESFNPFLGLMNQYEIVYIVGDEKDLVKLRANYRKDIVRMYPMNATKEQIQSLFSSVMYRADKLTKEPEFYNTLWNTCTTSILRHVNTLRSDKISPFDEKVLLPSNSDKIAYNLWLIDTSLSLEEARSYYEINELSENFAKSEDYSQKIRREVK